MFKLISLGAIKKGTLDAALEKFGYIRTARMALRWGLTPDRVNKYFSAGYTCDCFKINGVRYISINAQNPKEWVVEKEKK